MGVEVPPAFAAFNSNDEDRPAALIEWFYEWETEGVRYVPGSNFMNRMILNFDTRRGTQHNVGTILKLLRLFEARGLIEEGLNHWGKVFVFDAVIGNTDRHQDNWGVLWLGRGTEIADMRANFSPAFDNGTSLGHEILERNLLSLQDSARLEKYILRGRHHAKWSIKDEQRMQHAALVQLYADELPEVRDNIVRCLEVDMGQLEAQLRELCDFDGGIPFTEARCDMVISLLNARIAALSAALGI